MKPSRPSARSQRAFHVEYMRNATHGTYTATSPSSSSLSTPTSAWQSTPSPQSSLSKATHTPNDPSYQPATTDWDAIVAEIQSDSIKRVKVTFHRADDASDLIIKTVRETFLSDLTLETNHTPGDVVFTGPRSEALLYALLTRLKQSMWVPKPTDNHQRRFIKISITGVSLFCYTIHTLHHDNTTSRLDAWRKIPNCIAAAPGEHYNIIVTTSPLSDDDVTNAKKTGFITNIHQCFLPPGARPRKPYNQPKAPRDRGTKNVTKHNPPPLSIDLETEEHQPEEQTSMSDDTSDTSSDNATPTTTANQTSTQDAHPSNNTPRPSQHRPSLGTKTPPPPPPTPEMPQQRKDSQPPPLNSTPGMSKRVPRIPLHHQPNQHRRTWKDRQSNRSSPNPVEPQPPMPPRTPKPSNPPRSPPTERRGGS